MAKARVVIYLRDIDEGHLDDTEKQCGEYAERFGWQVLDVIRHVGPATSLSQLAMKANNMKAQIILTGSLDMISADQDALDNFMEAIERHQCIVHPIRTPPRRHAVGRSGRAARSGRAQKWIRDLDGQQLRQARRQRGLSQEALADLAGLSLTTVARLERQPCSPCRAWTLAALALALHKSPAVLASHESPADSAPYGQRPNGA